MDILALKIFREEILKRLPTKYRRNTEIYILSLRKMEICFSLPANYRRCEELSIDGKYLHFLERPFKVIKRYDSRKRWYSLQPENWEEFIKLLKQRIRELRNQVFWGLTVSPKWVYETLKSLSFLSEEIKSGLLFLAVASHPYASPVGVLNLKTQKVGVFTFPLEDLGKYFLTELEEEFLRITDLCGRIGLMLSYEGRKILAYLIAVEFDEIPRWELWESWTPRE